MKGGRCARWAGMSEGSITVGVSEAERKPEFRRGSAAVRGIRREHAPRGANSAEVPDRDGVRKVARRSGLPVRQSDPQPVPRTPARSSKSPHRHGESTAQVGPLPPRQSEPPRYRGPSPRFPRRRKYRSPGDLLRSDAGELRRDRLPDAAVGAATANRHPVPPSHGSAGATVEELPQPTQHRTEQAGEVPSSLRQHRFLRATMVPPPSPRTLLDPPAAQRAKALPRGH